MLAEAYIENDEIRIIHFPKNIFKGKKHWKVNIEPIEEIKENISFRFDDFIGVLNENFQTNDLKYNEIVK